MDLLSTARKTVHLLHLRPFHRHSRNAADGKHAMLLLTAQPVACGVQCQKNAEQRGRHYLRSKYHGHFLHEILRIDPAYLTWIAFKFQPRIPKQERFVQIAKIYHSVHLDIQRRKTYQTTGGRFLGKEGEKVENLTLTVFSVRLEDNPYKTQLKGTTPYFYVRQVLKLKDSIGNFVSIRLNARTASRKSCQLPAVEHAYQVGELMEIASARIARTYIIGSTKYTRLTHVKLHIPTG